MAFFPERAGNKAVYIGCNGSNSFIRDQFCGLANSLVCFKKQLALESVILTRVVAYLAFGDPPCNE